VWQNFPFPGRLAAPFAIAVDPKAFLKFARIFPGAFEPPGKVIVADSGSDAPNRLGWDSIRSVFAVCFADILNTMISLKQIAEFISVRPFRQFGLETIGGQIVTVESESHIKLPPEGFDVVVVFGTDGLVHHLPVDSIATASVYGPAPHTERE
jgi:hypothetical protein